MFGGHFLLTGMTFLHVTLKRTVPCISRGNTLKTGSPTLTMCVADHSGLPVHRQTIMLLQGVVIIQPTFLTLKNNLEFFLCRKKQQTLGAEPKLELESRKLREQKMGRVEGRTSTGKEGSWLCEGENSNVSHLECQVKGSFSRGE